ncbi:MAG: mRNA cleavage and polyadenylation factor subunit [Bathelium mastoideum]|nr:MAG: mRNA cleavage and polyadenylation factor subunit [Bathelium mastoideum]
MQCYTELTPPTAVEHSVVLPFVSPSATNLVVAKSSLLQIFELTNVTEIPSRLTDAAQDANSIEGILPTQRSESRTRLVLVSEHTISGVITSLARISIQNSKSGGDALLVSFQDAKLSLLEWDPEYHGLSTISVHYYEGEDLQGAPFTHSLGQFHNYLQADPGSRCAALKFGARHLAILPFRQPGDDLVEDFDSDLDEPLAKSKTAATATDGNQGQETPYAASFVLPLTALDSTLIHPIHLAFLHEYREPTFGIVSSSKGPSSALLDERKDIVNYNVYTLDLEQRASTTLLSVSGLPSDIFKIVPLPLPVGGALLVGSNEFVHVDQAGNTSAVAVNEFAKQSSAISMSDQSDLSLKLEGSSIAQISDENGDTVVVLHTGELIVLSFKIDGRSISGLSVHKVGTDQGGTLLTARPSCISNLGHGKLFIGSEEGDSVLLGWTSKAPQLARKRSHAQMLEEEVDLEFDEEDLDDLDDDLYGDSSNATKQQSSASAGSASPNNYIFRVNDTLTNLGPASVVAIGDASIPTNHQRVMSVDQARSDKELLVSTGRGRAGAIAILDRTIRPELLRDHTIPEAQAVWSVYARASAPKGMPQPENGQVNAEAELSSDSDYTRFIIVSKRGEDDVEESAVLKVTDTSFEEMTESELEADAGATVDVGTLARGTRIVQVLKSEVRSYNHDFNLEQILPIADESSDAELRVVGASFADPYLLIRRDDSSIMILKADERGEIDEVDKSEILNTTRWISGCLYRSLTSTETTLLCLLSAQGGLKASQMFNLPDLTTPTHSVDSLSYLSSVLVPGEVPRRAAAREELAEILVADLGDSGAKSPHLIVRTAWDDVFIYKPYHLPENGSDQQFTTNLRWIKLDHPLIANWADSDDALSEEGPRLKLLPDLGGYSAVFIKGTTANLILKEASSAPRILELRTSGLQDLATFHAARCEKGYVFIGADGKLHEAELPQGVNYGQTGWAHRRLNLGQDVLGLCYHARQRVYAVGTSRAVDFQLSEADAYKEYSKEDGETRPQVDHSILKLIDPTTWSIIDEHPLLPYETITSLHSMPVETSETKHQRKELIVVGTTFVRGEDLATRGRIYIFDVPDVVPEPGQPETDKKLKLFAHEELQGAVTAISSIGSQGCFVVAQGQKIMVRGIKEDGLLTPTILPVAFLDVQCFTNVLKNLPGTGYCLIGDALKGVWFAGYTEEPYKILLFGKGRSHMETIAAEFLPNDKQLHFAVADADCNLHMLQFDPDHPKSLSGQRLLHRSTFHTGHFPSSMTLVSSSQSLPSSITNGTNGTPQTLDGTSDPLSLTPRHSILLTTQTGALALLTSLSESSYRRLGALQAALAPVLEPVAGLNPRAHRRVEGGAGGGEAGASLGGGAGGAGGSGRGMVDGNLVARVWALGSQRRMDVLGRCGAEGWEIREDLAGVGSGGLGGFV